jgi:hypothetical protein
MNNTEYSNMSKPNKKELYILIVNALTEGDSYIVTSNGTWVKKPYIGGFVALEEDKYKQSVFSLEICYYSERLQKYDYHKYDYHKYK